MTEWGAIACAEGGPEPSGVAVPGAVAERRAAATVSGLMGRDFMERREHHITCGVAHLPA
jgi:hypothetical protein